MSAPRGAPQPFSSHCPSVQDISKLSAGPSRPRLSPVEQSDRVFRRRRTQVHVALRRRQVRMSGELLNRSCRRALHRQVRTERVPQDVDALVDPATRWALRMALITRSRVIGDPSARHRTRSDWRCRAALRAGARSKQGRALIPTALRLMVTSRERSAPHRAPRTGGDQGTPWTCPPHVQRSPKPLNTAKATSRRMSPTWELALSVRSPHRTGAAVGEVIGMCLLAGGSTFGRHD